MSDTDDSATKRKSKRPRLQYSLRTLLLVITGLAICLGIWVKPAHDQKVAIEAILHAGGEVYYDHNFEYDDSDMHGNVYLPGAEPPGPRWLCRLLGPEYFATPVCVDFSGQAVSRADLGSLHRLKQLHILMLRDSRFPDESLVQLQGLTSLRHLHLRDSTVTNEGVAHLKGLTGLLWLDLTGTRVSTRALPELQRSLPDCTILVSPGYTP